MSTAVGSNVVPKTHRPKASSAPALPSLPGARLTHLTGHVGTVVDGFDLASCTSDDVKAIKKLLAQRGVLHFTGQAALDNGGQVAFCRKLGLPYVHKSYKAEEFPDLMKLHVDASSDYVFGAEAWHADISYEQLPAQYTTLRMVVCPETGGDTAFVYMPGVLDKFSPAMRSIFKSTSAVHESYHVFKGEYGQAHRQADKDGNKGSNAAAVDAPSFPESIHPMVIRHPETGVESLYINRSFTTKLLGMPTFESKALMELVHNVTSNATEYQCRIKWTPNSVTIWDNYIVQHTANFDYSGQTRTAFRVTTLAEKPPVAAAEGPRL